MEHCKASQQRLLDKKPAPSENTAASVPSKVTEGSNRQK